MQELVPPDAHHLLAASGWLDLGARGEAAAELEQISPAFQEHPDVLEVKWQAAAEDADWAMALGLASILVREAPDRAGAWIHQAYAMRRAPGGGLEKAREVLLAAVDRFPRESIIPYNLACYDAQAGRLAQAWDWLCRAVETAGDAAKIKEMALHDPDLAPLADRVRGL